MQLSVAVRNARLNAIEQAIGASPRLRLLTGAPPASCATAQSGTLLAEIVLPADWLADAGAGSKALAGAWQGSGAAAGTIGYFRLLDSAGATCHAQGTVTATGGAGDMTVDNTSLALGQSIQVNTFTVIEANA